MNGNFGLKHPTDVIALIIAVEAPCSRYPSIGSDVILKQKISFDVKVRKRSVKADMAGVA